MGPAASRTATRRRRTRTSTFRSAARADAALSPAILTRHRTRSFRALSYDFRIETDLPALARYLDDAFEAMAVPHEAAHVLSIDTGGPEPQLALDDRALGTASDPALLLPTVMSVLNRAVREAAANRLLVHASAVETAGRALLFPAAMEAGKSTLAAGLVRAGYRYVTDEVVALDPDSATIIPYPRPLSIDRGSWETLADLRPDLPPALEPYCAEQWHVSPLSMRPDAVAPTCPPALVAFPRYRHGARTRASRIRSSAALKTLIECTFNLERHGVRGFAALAELVQVAPCYRLAVGDLDTAVRAVDRLVARLDAPAATERLPVQHEPTPVTPVSMTRPAGAASSPMRRPGVAWVALDRVVVFDPEPARVFVLNDTASLLWQLLDGHVTLAELARDLGQAYERPADEVALGLLRVVRRLDRLGLLSG